MDSWNMSLLGMAGIGGLGLQVFVGVVMKVDTETMNVGQ